MSMSASSLHQSVMLQEAIVGLNIKQDGRYVDATFGRGGHSSAILNELGPEGSLLAIDKDPEAVLFAKDKFGHDQRFHMFHGSFANLKSILNDFGWHKVDGIVFDFGVSSPQLDEAERGFSYSKDGPLDMRMNTEEGLTAAEWLASADEAHIKEVLKVYGEEKYSAKIAEAIVKTRANHQQALNRTGDLVKLILNTLTTYQKKKNPATRTFQAIRIAINHELDDIQKALDDVVDLMEKKARLVFISFQSLEHKIIKAFIRQHTAGNEVISNSSVMTQRKNPQLKRIGRERVSSKEIDDNRRSRSAWMRIVEKI